jgi:DNA-binding winged helix-turn-helix (wHTH) protein
VRDGGQEEQVVRYRFGDYLFDTERYELHRAGVLVPLRPKECDLLAYLSPAAPCPCLPLGV